MSKTKVVKMDSESIQFDNGLTLGSFHSQDCCESHCLSFADLTISDFEGLEFDLSGEGFFKRIEGYGIELIPVAGHPVRVPGYGYNNGYYSSNLDLVLADQNGNVAQRFDVSECQKIED